ncbi:GNAT family N-acetyltransferase [Shinella sp. G-2]|uniref:GNAT family N-acetyltransferase n=1 Tax=Shinella sp. G-2 TaxID=3133141 RepID=UPI003D06B6FA
MPNPLIAKTIKDFPSLATARLRLRQIRPEDCEAVHALLSCPEVTRFSDWPDAPSRRRAERAVKWMDEMFAKGKGCAWMIEEGASAVLLGAIRFNSIDARNHSAEVGYELHPAAWGKGYMSEALEAVAACGFGPFGLNRIEAWTLPGNPASDRVLEKAGFHYEGTLRQKAWFKGAFHDFRMFSRLAGA